MAIDIPPQQHDQVVCSISAAIKYEVPANIVLAVADKEGGKPGQRVNNTNGTQDVGPMQFNTAYLKELNKYGISEKDVAKAGCYSYNLAAWRLKGHIDNDRNGDIWTRAANYHSKTPKYNAPYRASLIALGKKWEGWIKDHYQTYDAGQVSTASIRVPIATPPLPSDSVAKVTPLDEPSQERPAKGDSLNIAATRATGREYSNEAEAALASVYSPQAIAQRMNGSIPK